MTWGGLIQCHSSYWVLGVRGPGSPHKLGLPSHLKTPIMTSSDRKTEGVDLSAVATSRKEAKEEVSDPRVALGVLKCRFK